MRKRTLGIVLITILTIVMASVIGCGNSNTQDTPEGTVRLWLKAYELKDATTLLENMGLPEDEDRVAYWEGRWGSNTFSMSSVKVTITNQNETTAEATATCNMVVKNSQGSIQYQGGTTWDFSLLKTNGIWEVDSDVSAQQTG